MLPLCDQIIILMKIMVALSPYENMTHDPWLGLISFISRVSSLRMLLILLQPFKKRLTIQLNTQVICASLDMLISS